MSACGGQYETRMEILTLKPLEGSFDLEFDKVGGEGTARARQMAWQRRFILKNGKF